MPVNDPEQVGEVRGITDIVLYPPMGKALDSQRVRQMHPGVATDGAARQTGAGRRAVRRLPSC
jgi:hypothetical protein